MFGWFPGRKDCHLSSSLPENPKKHAQDMDGGEQAEAAGALGADEVALEQRGLQFGTKRKSSVVLRLQSFNHKFPVNTYCVYCAHHTVFPQTGCGELPRVPVPKAHR